MQMFSYLLVPVIIAAIALFGFIKKVDVYGSVIEGAQSGMTVIKNIFPPLVALFCGIYMLRASGAFDLLSNALAPVLGFFGIPKECATLMFIRPFSGSGALAAGSDIMKTYGVDSQIGKTAAVMLGATETTFYTIAVYFGALGIKKTRYAVAASLIADIVGFAAAALAVRLFLL